MALKFYYNDTTYSLADFTASDSTASTFTEQSPALFHYYQNTGSSSTAEHKIPASSTRGTSVQFAEDDNYYYKMDNSAPTLCFRKNDTTFYCAKSITSEAKYNIPAGTYTPSAFETLIKQYISKNSSRTIANAFTVTVNNQTYSAGAILGSSEDPSIYYCTNWSSGSATCRKVCFNGSRLDYDRTVADFNKYGQYVVGGTSSSSFNFDTYANYNITVTTGIKFS